MRLLNLLVKFPPTHYLLSTFFAYSDPSLNRSLFGLSFPNPIGLAAGFDKDGKYIKALAVLGFGFIEIGTVTPKPQGGNPKPRLFRLPKSKGVINRMGFNNDGVEALVRRLKNFDRSGMNLILGGNIGKNKTTPNEKAKDDYLICFEALFDYVDYFVVNVSSPNTPGLRDLQDKAPLTELLQLLQKVNNEKETRKPILLKIAPDLSDAQLDDIIEIVEVTQIDGVVATNTTISRDGISETKERINQIGAGGLSGEPVRARSTSVIQYLSQKSGGKFPIIGVGGISEPNHVVQKIYAGAQLVQIYSGMIYEGPFLIKRIKKHIVSQIRTSPTLP